MSELKQVNDHDRTTITLSRENYQKLKRLGYTAESFDTVIGRLLANVNLKENRN